MSRDQLEYLADTRAQQVSELQDEVARLRDFSSGANGAADVAVSTLVEIVSDSSASPRQRIKASGAILGYKVQDDEVIEFVKGFLQSVCTSIDIAIDYRIEAGELLRKHEAPRIASESVRPDYRDGDEAAKWSEALAEVKRRAAVYGHPSFTDDEETPRVRHTDLATALREARLRVSANARVQAGLPPVDDVTAPADDDGTAAG